MLARVGEAVTADGREGWQLICVIAAENGLYMATEPLVSGAESAAMVEPDQIRSPTASDVWPTLKDSIGGIAVGMAVLAGLAAAADFPLPFLVTWLLLTAIGVSARFVYIQSSITESRTKDQARYADERTKQARALLDVSRKASAAIVTNLQNASGWLRNAEQEFEARAFGPFWNAIEGAAQNLDEFRIGVTLIGKNGKSYVALLAGHRHSFPPFGVRFEPIPDPRPAATELQRLVRKGQTDFQFANIWEHRRTRSVLIAGFQTLEDGLNNLGASITTALSGLEQGITSHLLVVSSGQDELTETTRNYGDVHTRMLDNIQRQRKPSMLE